MGFVLENRYLFVLNSDIHDRDTRNGPYLHIFFTHLTSVQRGVFHSGCKIFNCLPLYIKKHFDNHRYFRKLLKCYLLEQTFYSLEEFYQKSVLK